MEYIGIHGPSNNRGYTVKAVLPIAVDIDLCGYKIILEIKYSK